MTNENVKLELVEEEKPKRKIPAIVWAGIATAVTGFIGFKFGKAAEAMLVNAGLDKCFKEDPTLKEHLATVMAQVTKNNLMQS